MTTTQHAATYTDDGQHWTVRCRCGWSHRAPLKGGAQSWYRQHRDRPAMVCPVDGGTVCNQHGARPHDGERIVGYTASGRAVFGLPHQPDTRTTAERASWAEAIALGSQQ